MTTFKVGDKARKVNSNVGDWLSDGELVTITAVHDNRSVSVANGRANLVVDVSHLQPEPAPTADPQPTAGEKSGVKVVVEKVLGLWRYEIYVDGKTVAIKDGYHTEALARDVANHEAKKYRKDDPLILAYGDGYAAGYADGLKEHDRLQAEVSRLADELAQARAFIQRLADRQPELTTSNYRHGKEAAYREITDLAQGFLGEKDEAQS